MVVPTATTLTHELETQKPRRPGRPPGRQLRRTFEREDCPVRCYGFTVRIAVTPVTA